MKCARCEEMKAKIDWLEGELGLRVEAAQLAALRRGFGLSQAPARVVLTLYAAKGAIVPVCQLAEAIPERDHVLDREDDRLIAVYATKLRKALGKDAIENAWGAGYRLTDAGLARVGEAIRQPQ